MRLDVVTPRGRLLSVEVTEVTAPGIKGEFGVLPGHVPFLSALRPGIVHYAGPSGSGKLAVGAGYAEVSHDQVTVLADAGAAAPALVEKLEALGGRVPAVDAEAARQELSAAQRELDAYSSDDVAGRTVLQYRVDWAQARLDALA